MKVSLYHECLLYGLLGRSQYIYPYSGPKSGYAYVIFIYFMLMVFCLHHILSTVIWILCLYLDFWYKSQKEYVTIFWEKASVGSPRHFLFPISSGLTLPKPDAYYLCGSESNLAKSENLNFNVLTWKSGNVCKGGSKFGNWGKVNLPHFIREKKGRQVWDILKN